MNMFLGLPENCREIYIENKSKSVLRNRRTLFAVFT